MPGDQVDAMKSAGPAPTRYNPAVPPITKLIREATRRSNTSRIVIEKPGFHLELTGDPSMQAEAAQ
jgi:oxaloacetate decarboxylase alpha subunit